MSLGESIERNAAFFPEKLALNFEGKAFTLREVASRALGLASALESAGIRRQDRVAIVAPNCGEDIDT